MIKIDAAYTWKTEMTTDIYRKAADVEILLTLSTLLFIG